MKYSAKTASGDAGEFFFAYQIASVLGWPCRLFDIDIGIDAQVEVLDEAGNSTGKFVAFQVKTTTAEGSATYRHVRKRQLSYWLDLDIPVFVVLVDLPSETMYLHRITASTNYVPTKKGFVRIDFDTAKQRFTRASGVLIAAAADEAALEAVREYLNEVEHGIHRIRGTLQRAPDAPEPRTLIEIMLERGALRDRMARAEAISRGFRAGQDECSAVKVRLEEALEALRDFMADWKMERDWDDRESGDGEIRKFLDETR